MIDVVDVWRRPLGSPYQRPWAGASQKERDSYCRPGTAITLKNLKVSERISNDPLPSTPGESVEALMHLGMWVFGLSGKDKVSLDAKFHPAPNSMYAKRY